MAKIWLNLSIYPNLLHSLIWTNLSNLFILWKCILLTLQTLRIRIDKKQWRLPLVKKMHKHIHIHTQVHASALTRTHTRAHIFASRNGYVFHVTRNAHKKIKKCSDQYRIFVPTCEISSIVVLVSSVSMHVPFQFQQAEEQNAGQQYLGSRKVKMKNSTTCRAAGTLVSFSFPCKYLLSVTSHTVELLLGGNYSK